MALVNPAKKVGAHCANCEINRPEAKIANHVLALERGAKHTITLCHRCVAERKVDSNVDRNVNCLVCGKPRRVMFRQACRQSSRCLNCLVGQDLLPELSNQPVGPALPVAAPAKAIPIPPPLAAPKPPPAAATVAPQVAKPIPAAAAKAHPLVANQERKVAPAVAEQKQVPALPRCAEANVPAPVAKAASPAAAAPAPGGRLVALALNPAPAAANDIRLIEPASTMRLFQPEELKVGRELGRGSFKKAFMCDWNGTPVVKVCFHFENQNLREAGRNFRDELSVVARLAHPNIVQFLGRCQGELAFVIAHCAHGSLFDALFGQTAANRAARQRLTHPVRLHIALGVARALTFLHRCVPPVLHRDLKGSNVLLTEHLDARLSDFGLTLMKLHAHGISRHKGEGTANYMAPELFEERAQNITEKTDVWSLGCVLIELFASALPWQRLDELAIARRVTAKDERTSTPPELEQVPQSDMRALIRRCIRADPAARPFAADVLAALEQMAQAASDTPTPTPAAAAKPAAVAAPVIAAIGRRR